MKTKFNIGDTVYTCCSKKLLILKIKGIEIKKIGNYVVEQYLVEKNLFYEKIDSRHLFSSKEKAVKYFSKRDKWLKNIKSLKDLKKANVSLDNFIEKNRYEPDKRVDD